MDKKNSIKKNNNKKNKAKVDIKIKLNFKELN